MKTKMKNPHSDICAGQFMAGEVKAGVFYGGEIEPGTFHKAFPSHGLASKAGDEKPKEAVKDSGSDAESSEEDETPSGNGESQD